jgi:hypothetical protein
MGRHRVGADTSLDRKEVKRMKKFSWRPLAYSLATLVVVALAAGARYKP